MARQNPSTTDPTEQAPPAPFEETDGVVAGAPEPAPSSRRRPPAPIPLVRGDVVEYGATTYPVADAVELGLIPAPPRL